MIDGSDLLTYEDLRALGVPWSEVHLHRLEKTGQFPRRVVFSAQRKLYIRSEVVAWVQARVAARDAQPEQHAA